MVTLRVKCSQGEAFEKGKKSCQCEAGISELTTRLTSSVGWPRASRKEDSRSIRRRDVAICPVRKIKKNNKAGNLHVCQMNYRSANNNLVINGSFIDDFLN